MKYALLLIVATVVSAQLLMLASRRRPLAARLRDLSESGDVATIGGAVLLMCGSLGALIGHLFNHPGDGAATGLAVALLAITIAVIWAHRRPQPPPRHRDDDPPA
ncbi:hypothetical protein ACFVWG_39010 [Kribbella sp. NPDC058245]|uniref:hypothetical protein n=1 Tax=Kribbella sp. NPDC058245 TaxID=3346399 RepID=UPI0036EAC865